MNHRMDQQERNYIKKQRREINTEEERKQTTRRERKRDIVHTKGYCRLANGILTFLRKVCLKQKLRSAVGSLVPKAAARSILQPFSMLLMSRADHWVTALQTERRVSSVCPAQMAPMDVYFLIQLRPQHIVKRVKFRTRDKKI